jgi:hypothetical protein
MDRHTYKSLTLATAAAAALAVLPVRAPAQVSIGVGIGAPDCPYGYFDYAPYACAPYGYYGPEWFLNGVFIGAGPWYHGGHDFRGHVDSRFDPHHGYHGTLPRVGEHRRPDVHVERMARGFRGDEMHDGHGQVHDNGRGHEEHHGPG